MSNVWGERSSEEAIAGKRLEQHDCSEKWKARELRRRNLLTVISSLTVATRRNYGALSTLSGGSSTEGEGGRTGRRRTHRFSLSHSVTSDTSLHPCQSLARLMLAT